MGNQRPEGEWRFSTKPWGPEEFLTIWKSGCFGLNWEEEKRGKAHGEKEDRTFGLVPPLPAPYPAKPVIPFCKLCMECVHTQTHWSSSPEHRPLPCSEG